MSDDPKADLRELVGDDPLALWVLENSNGVLIDKGEAGQLESIVFMVGRRHAKWVPGVGFGGDEALATMAVAALQEDRAELLAEVREWMCFKCRTIYPENPQPGLMTARCPKCGGATRSRVIVEAGDLIESIERLKKDREAMRAELAEADQIARDANRDYRDLAASLEPLWAGAEGCKKAAEDLRGLAERARELGTRTGELMRENDALREAYVVCPACAESYRVCDVLSVEKSEKDG